MRMQFKVLAAIVTMAAFLSINAAISSAGAGPGHRAHQRAHHRAHPADTRAGSALLARCRADKSRGVDSGACAALNASQQGVDPNSTPALRALLQQCLAAKAGRPEASPSACAALDQASGN